MMARLFGEDRRGERVATELRRVVTLKEREVADRVRREDVLPRKRLHIVARAPTLILAGFLLIGQIGHVEALPIEKEVEAHEVFLVRLIIELEETFGGRAVVMKIFERGRVEKAVGGRRGGTEEVTPLARVPAKVERAFVRVEAATRIAHAARFRNLQTRARIDG